MHGKTKIVVLHLKELLYTLLLILAVLTLIVLLIIMFKPSGKGDNDLAKFTPGMYASSLSLGGEPMEVEVTVDQNTICSITLKNLNDSVATMYPLIKPSFDELVNQIYETQSLEGLTYSDERHYTSVLLLNAIKQALDKACVSENQIDSQGTEL